MLLSPVESGDIKVIDLDGSADLNVKPSALLAASSKLTLNLDFNSLGFGAAIAHYRVSGKGLLALSLAGTIEQIK